MHCDFLSGESGLIKIRDTLPPQAYIYRELKTSHQASCVGPLSLASAWPEVHALLVAGRLVQRPGPEWRTEIMGEWIIPPVRVRL